MAEIIFLYEGAKVDSSFDALRWLGPEDFDLFNKHLLLCGQQPLKREVWQRIHSEGIQYCLLFVNNLPVARACVEKYSPDRWEVADVRTAKKYRGRGLAYQTSAFVLNYILDHGRQATIRTEEDNVPMQHVIARLGFRPLP